MNNTLHKQLTAYYRNVRKHLPGKSAQKRMLFHSLKKDVESYIAEYEITDIASVYEQFGSPEDLAEDYAVEISTKELKKKPFRYRLVCVLSVTLAVALVVFVAYFIHEVRESSADHAIIYIEEIEEY